MEVSVLVTWSLVKVSLLLLVLLAIVLVCLRQASRRKEPAGESSTLELSRFPPDYDGHDPNDRAFLEKIESIVQAHLADPGFTVAGFALEMGISERHLQRRCQALTGCTPVEYVRTRRLQRAADLLDAGTDSIAETASAVGFTDPSYFARVFRRAFGTRPSEYPQRSDRSQDKSDMSAQSASLTGLSANDPGRDS